ncbi:hypothetical protein SeMB42_g00569 [Synchytrium endobioticum]|uniref:Transcriptional coactivator p15 (PC4) C-terminal domain-containing protein n=1 Tax=Synchytrium endobioticum TaxID=286115 RepID=A0A507DQC4_9FUNG|nr:hypothetical protein SeLEV6574_g01149 [Synchytrium endobioticum]TPX53884.1 hypothetical protein SeMB42_g00569 [Synchytrium endobioticum]
MPKKRKDSEDVDADDAVDDGADYEEGLDKETPSKKKATAQNKKQKKEAGARGKGGADGDIIQVDLDKTKKATVRTFKGKILIDIREYYTDKETEEEKPGKKGIALSVECWNKLKELMVQIDDAIDSAAK